MRLALVLALALVLLLVVGLASQDRDDVHTTSSDSEAEVRTTADGSAGAARRTVPVSERAGEGSPPVPPSPAPLRGGYERLLERLRTRQTALAATHAAAPHGGRAELIREASAHIERALSDSIWPHWFGTPWDFNGTTQTPGRGHIACGYFVTTCLRDVGYEVQRVRWAQLSASDLVERLVASEMVRRYSDVPVERFADSIATWGDGVYVIGLDCHVGFLLVRGGSVRFCHSTYVPPLCVVIEEAEDSGPLVHSRLRVVGRIVPNDELTAAWLETRYPETGFP